MQETSFKIYNASAGSGKTYTLAKEYLRLLLSANEGYRSILAITFTNKAVNEMKERILNSLFEFSTLEATQNPPPMFVALSQELAIDALELQKRAKHTLKKILHNYAFFDISTIDKFTHRLIRTFAKDLQLPQNFEVVLDIDFLLDEAVSRLLNKAGIDTKLTNVLLDFAFEKIDDDKSWDIANDLNKVGKLLFNETNIPHLKKFENKALDDFLQLQKEIKKKIKEKEQAAKLIAESALDLIDASGLQTTDFPRETLPNHFKKILDGVFSPAVLYANKLEENLITGKILKAKINLPSEAFPRQLLQLYLDVKERNYDRALLINVYKNIVPLTVLNAIQQEVKAIQKERDQLPISEFNGIISKEIKNQPAPFIYERLGEKYQHYFIDEFQDTSEMQWQNLIPLVDNALSGEKGSLFLVGDAKQAIYRWRGGKAEQFLNLVNGNENPFVVNAQVEVLPANYRSYEQIVAFNNEFFTASSTYLSSDSYKNLFEEGNKQRNQIHKKGLVQLTFLESDAMACIDEQYGEEVLETIRKVIQKKYAYKDICILVRGNKEGVALANFLAHEEIPIISSESLLLKSSPKIRFLVNLLRYQEQQDDAAISYELLYFLAKEEGRHHFMVSNLKDVVRYFKENYGFDIDRLRKSSVYDGLEYAIKQFDLAPDADAYITFFMDTVFDVEQKEGTGIATYLTYWEKKKDTLSITAPDTIDAVQIMTVHKAKGLEFDIVIFPYAHAQIYKEIEPKLWLPVEKEVYGDFEEVLISKKQEVLHYSPQAAQQYDDENNKLELDAYNVLYVALTRAVKALYIITKKNASIKEVEIPKSYSDLFTLYLKEKELWNGDDTVYAFGELDENAVEVMTKEAGELPYQYAYKERSSFRILTKSGQLWGTEREDALYKGNLLHYAMGLIETENDIENALSQVLRNGDVTADEVDGLKTKIQQLIHHPQLYTFYKTGNTIKNEKEIITKNGRILRPDRVVLKNSNATVIDYKTGKSDASYKMQVYAYADALQEMGYEISNKIIIYINEEITPEFI